MDILKEAFSKNISDTPWKEFVLAIILILGALAAGYFWNGLGSLTGVPENKNIYGELIALFFLVIAFLLIASFGNNRVAAIGGIGIAAIALFIFQSFQNIFLIGLAAFIVFSLWGLWAIRRDIRGNLVFHWRVILRDGLGKFFTGLTLLFSILYFSILAPSATVQEVFLPKEVFQGLVTILENPIQNFLPGFTAQSSVDDVLFGVLVETVDNTINIRQVPEAEIKKALADQRANISRQFGIKLSGKEKAADAMYTFASQQIDQYAKPYKIYIPIILAVGYFGILRFLLYLYSFVFMLLFPLVVKFLFTIGFLRKEMITIQKEVFRF